jgi:methylase of polypeptide subunit release factors
MPILTAKVGTNADLFPDVLTMWAKPGDCILDLTYGKGVFWRKIDRSAICVTTNDLVEPADHAYDLRQTEFPDNSFDVVVFDPPYMHTSGTVKESIAKCYNTNSSAVFKNQKDVDAFFVAGAAEAKRILKPKGILIVKCQDTIESAQPKWTHVKIMQMDGFKCEDLFILVQTTTPAMSGRWTKQYHARKNHSYFIVLRKLKERN